MIDLRSNMNANFKASSLAFLMVTRMLQSAAQILTTVHCDVGKQQISIGSVIQ
jgi:hypothetical protein